MTEKPVLEINLDSKTFRDFYYLKEELDNKGKSLEEAIRGWSAKKQLRGHNRYEKSDLEAIGGREEGR